MSFSIAALPWLPPPPSDLSARIRAAGETGAGADLQGLAGFALTSSQATSFVRALKKLRAKGADLSPLTPLRLGVLTAHTFDLVADALVVGACRHGVELDLVMGGYGQVMQDALSPQSAVNQAQPDAVLVAIDHRWLGLEQPDLEHASARVEAALDQVGGVLSAVRATAACSTILHTLPIPPDPLFGSLDAREAGSVRAMIAAVNRALPALAATHGANLLDVAALAERIGTDAWFDPVHWLSHKIPFAPAYGAIYGDWLGRLLAALRGATRKCLVLDLDNTLWGGVLGDDGPDALRIGPGDPVGEAFEAVQRYALALQRRGVFLAVSSKNDDAAARAAFQALPGMSLTLDQIAVFQANWLDKPSNLAAIARELNIGLDALVLLDDNPAERAHVRSAAPQVAVPELPSDPSAYIRTLAAAGYFESLSFSSEDRLRGAGQGAQADRAKVLAGSGSVADYLAGLEMRLTLKPFDAAGRGRITQLINKTNQFNLTTRRRAEADVAGLEADTAFVTLQAQLADRFGDLGMIAVLVAREAVHENEPALAIDTWLMSCRVLGRGVEEAMFAALLDAAEARGVAWLTGDYRPTLKNAPVADLLPRLGLTPLGEDAGAFRYALRTVEARRPSPSIRVEAG